MSAQSRPSKRLLMAACALVLLSVTACEKKAEGSSASSTSEDGVAAQGAGSEPSGAGVCALLTTGEAKAAFPNIRSAKPDNSRAFLGITSCSWENASGAMVFEVRVSKSSPEDEFGMLGMGVMSEHDVPPRPDIVDGVQVVIFDHKIIPGVRQDMAIAAVQKGKQTVDTLVNDLGTDHTKLKENLSKLTKSAAERLK